MSPFECSVCAGGESRHLLTYRDYDLFRCGCCSHVQVYPLPSWEQIASHYSSSGDQLDNNFAYRNLEDYRKSPRSTYKFKRRAFKDLVKELRRRGTGMGARILEWGASTGTDLAVLRDFYGYKNENLAGIEINAASVERGRRELGLDLRSGQTGSGFAADCPPFDAVYALHVIEHVIAPAEMLTEIASVLREDGLLFLNLPNYNSLYRVLLGESWQWLMPPGHLHYFTPSSLRLLLEKNGFRVITLYSEQNFFPGGYLADMLRVVKKILGRRKQETGDYIPPFSYYDRGFPLLWAADVLARTFTFPLWLYTRLFDRGSCLIAVARKKGKGAR